MASWKNIMRWSPPDSTTMSSDGEQHVVEDICFIPSLSECLDGLKLERWMAGPRSPATSSKGMTADKTQDS